MQRWNGHREGISRQMSNYILTEYQISSEISLKQTLTIVLLADLHEKGTEEIVELVKSVSPDLICIAGDTFERSEKNKEKKHLEPQYENSCSRGDRMIHTFLMLMDHVFCLFTKKDKLSKRQQTKQTYEFLQKLQGIAPVYMSLGNHERYLTGEDRRVLTDAGIVLLDNSVAGMKGVQIGGLSSVPDWEWLSQYTKMDGYKILLSHHPERFPKFSGIDLVLSGHAHGGQIRVKERGIYAPGQGLLPKYTRGIYEGESGKMIVSAGCANTASIPRWGNPCEVVVIRVKGASVSY